MADATTALRRMCWVFPDRESTRTAEKWAASFWRTYTDVAADMGLSWVRTAPEAVTVDALDPLHPKVYVDGQRVTPEDTLFVTSPYTLPYQAVDTLNQFTLYSVLEHAGFYLPDPPSFAAVGTDKLATLLYFKDSPIPPIPTIRVSAGRDLLYDEFMPAVENLPYPAFVKPAGWAAARGINLARDVQDVRGLLSLAQGGDTTLVFQPYLGTRTVDHRVYMVDGRAHTVMVRVSGDGALYPQLSTGARAAYVPMPTELIEATEYFAKKLPLPYFCIDFLHDGDRFWFSEVELDGGIICPDSSNPEVVARQRSIVRDRFLAYRKAHESMLAGAL